MDYFTPELIASILTPVIVGIVLGFVNYKLTRKSYKSDRISDFKKVMSESKYTSEVRLYKDLLYHLSQMNKIIDFNYFKSQLLFNLNEDEDIEDIEDNALDQAYIDYIDFKSFMLENSSFFTKEIFDRLQDFSVNIANEYMIIHSAKGNIEDQDDDLEKLLVQLYDFIRDRLDSIDIAKT